MEHMTKVDTFADKLLKGEFDKTEALDYFAKISDEEKLNLLTKLKENIPGGKVQFETDNQAKKDNVLLKSVDQRELNEKHRTFINKLTQDYEKFVPKSKENIMKYQAHFVDQRRTLHLIKDLKNMHFQITYKAAEGAYIYDVDGNKYIDISGDMGVNIFGHKPPFIVNAVKEALDRGIPLSGYSETIQKATELFCKITGHQRMLYTQSGTEAVMFAVRIARAATGRKKIVLFDGSFHGLSDAVVATKDKDGRSIAMGPGMLQEFADQIIVLDYGDLEQLNIIEEHSNEIAAVLVEPVQSRHPYRKPVEFLQELRKLTLEKDIPLIMDEMITGFRICPKGAQGYFGVKGDIATYGKIPGGGMPTGIVAGSAKYMDIVDGGTWNFGDDSMPKSKRTGMAGTHTQNPLKVAASYALLLEIQKRSSENQDCSDCDKCTCFQKDLNKKTQQMAEELNSFFSENNLPIIIDYFGSLFRFRFFDSFWGITEALFFILLRMNGVETNIQGNMFLTTAHSDDDIKMVINCVKNSLKTLLENGFFRKADEVQPVQSTRESSDHPIQPQNNKKKNESFDNQFINQVKNFIKADLQKFQKSGNGK